jgi:hypothetical protein
MQPTWNLQSICTLVVRLLCSAALVAAVGCGGGKAITPSSLSSNSARYDGQDITVSGTVKNPTARQMRRGTATMYQLCDSVCVNVFQFGAANVSDGDQQTVRGRYHVAFGRRRFHMHDVIVVGGRMGG